MKAYSLDAAIADFAAAVGPETMVIPTLNGMRHLDILEECFGREVVVGGVCKVAATIDPDGRIVQLAPFQELAYGERDSSVLSRMKQLDDFMQGAGFDARLSRSIDYEMWEKWTMLATLGGITCLMRGNIGEVVAAPGGAPFILRFLDEVVNVVSAVGEAPKPAFLEGARKTLTTPGSTQSPSMFRDLSKAARSGRSNHRRPSRAGRKRASRRRYSQLLTRTCPSISSGLRTMTAGPDRHERRLHGEITTKMNAWRMLVRGMVLSCLIAVAAPVSSRHRPSPKGKCGLRFT